jgi:hypothetical protein
VLLPFIATGACDLTCHRIYLAIVVLNSDKRKIWFAIVIPSYLKMRTTCPETMSKYGNMWKPRDCI